MTQPGLHRAVLTVDASQGVSGANFIAHSAQIACLTEASVGIASGGAFSSSVAKRYRYMQ